MSDIRSPRGKQAGLPQIRPAGSENAHGFEDLMQEALGNSRRCRLTRKPGQRARLGR